MDAAEYFRALHAAWDKVRDEFGDAATPINPVAEYFTMTVNPPRMDRDGSVEFTLMDDARRGLELERARSDAFDGIRLPAGGAANECGHPRVAVGRQRRAD